MLVTPIATEPSEPQHNQTASHHDPEGEERDDHRRPVLWRNAVQTRLRRGQAVSVNQAAERWWQRNCEQIAPVLDIRPGEQYFGSRLLIVPASFDRGHLRRLIRVDVS